MRDLINPILPRPPVARRVEGLVSSLANIEESCPTIPREMAAMAGMKKLDIAPMNICAVTTGQNDGKNAIKRAPIAKATTPAAINALLD